MPYLFALLAMALGGDDALPSPTATPASPPNTEVRRVEGPAAAAGPMIAYEVQYVTTQNPDWRGKFDPRLTPVARQGGSTVWMTDAATTRELLDYLQGDARSEILQVPPLITPAEGEVRFDHGETIHYVAHLERIANGPVNQSSSLAFKPEVAQIQNGLRARLSSATFEDQGLRAHVAVDRDRLESMQQANYTETVVPAKEVPGDPAPAPGPGRRAHARPVTISGTIQMPVVDSARIDGEWVIPRDGALVVSLGTSEKTGKVFGTIRAEEMVVIRYRPAPGQSPTPVTPPQTITARPALLKGPAAN